MLTKLLLVRKGSVKSTLLSRMGADKFSEGDPIPVSPRTWSDENGLSHYGYLLQKMSNQDIKGIEKWIRENDPDAMRLYDYDTEADNPLETALGNVGLRVNESGE
jgi:hypothetical protein